MHHSKRSVILIGLALRLGLFGPASNGQVPGSQVAGSQALNLDADTIEVSLESAVARALAASPEVRSVEARRDYADARWSYARSYRFLSDFEATTAHSTAPGLKNDEGDPRDALYLDPDVRNDWEDLGFFNRIDVKLTQPILTWGELSGNIRAARYGIALEDESVRSKSLEVALRTAQLYYGVLLADDLARIASQAQDIVRQAIDEIQKQIDDGDESVDDADLYQVQIAEQDVKRRVVEVAQRRRTTRAALARQLMLPEGAVPDAGSRILKATTFELDSLSVYEAVALANRPEIAQAKAGLSAREALVDVARSDYYPKLFAAVSAKYSYAPGRYRQRNPYVSDPFLSRSVEAGVGFRQKLNFSQTGARVEQARAQADEIRFQGEAARQLVLYEVEDAYRNVITKRAAVETGDQALLISSRWKRDESINFDLDIGDTENLVRAVKANLELQASQAQAIFDYNVAVLKLLSATGTLEGAVESGMLVEPE